MPTLQLTVRWLAEGEGLPAYHGREWPPSPARVFRALLAGASRPGGSGARGREALRRLEQLDAPEISGPVPERLEPVATAVPNNDSDVVMELHRKGIPEQARKKQAALRTIRSRQGWSVPGPVTYLWRFPEPDPDPEAFSLLADGLTLLGQGTDLVSAEARWAEDAAPQSGYRWRPDEDQGGLAMPVPGPGEVERMESLHESARSRIRGEHVGGAQEPPAALAAYHDPMAPPTLRWGAFTLRLPDDSGPWSVPGEEAMRVTGMVRHALHQAARQAGLGDKAIGALMGHDGPGRLYALPVPNVAHKWADGRIRRVLIAAPPAVDSDTWHAVLLRMVSAELIEAGTGELKGMLAPVPRPEDDRILWRFTDAASAWSAASPIILPGFDTRRGRPRPGKSVRRLLRHAGIPEEAVRRVRLDEAPQLPGAQPARAVEVPHYLRSYPRRFVSIEFHTPVPGPLILGAGEGCGLGLLTHREHPSGAPAPREHSQDANDR
ncbi:MULTISPECIES: type I-U CRISPR-associated protein Csb2 [unclassified Thioalkalivibrio]|uniref:type I-G CRISPR-associated protein Csb2 n=1 Tax=unclassified Thioalkalivibrio TaxID=2621013 RepID=UPI00036966EE|nr:MULTISPECIES: type I-U CRISPR-associated protein Csb2 [unclassified Thioalkalivibrio]